MDFLVYVYDPLNPIKLYWIWMGNIEGERERDRESEEEREREKSYCRREKKDQKIRRYIKIL